MTRPVDAAFGSTGEGLSTREPAIEAAPGPTDQSLIDS